MEKTQRMRVVMVCHFSNQDVRDHLPLSDRKLYVWARRMLRLPAKTISYGDVAAWDTNIIDNLKGRDDVELYVISAHSGLKKRKVAFELDGVHYWFVRCDVSAMMKHLISSPKLWHALNPMRPLVRRIIKKIHPDLVTLVGAENAHISGTVLGLKGVPLFVKTQTIYNNPERKNCDVFDTKNAYVEKLIFQATPYFSIGSKMHYDMFKQFNDTAYNLKWRFASPLPQVEVVEKKYDFVNYAMSMSEKKGYHDTIKALAIVKRSFPNVKLNLTGQYSADTIRQLKDLVTEYDVVENVEFTPFFEKQSDLFQHIQHARFAVLPCKLDWVPFTIKQAMYYGLPVVCYETEGTPTLNKDAECVLIARHSDIEDLAAKMLQLMSDEMLAAKLRNNAQEIAIKKNDNESIANEIVADFKAVIDNYYYGKEIDTQLLCQY